MRYCGILLLIFIGTLRPAAADMTEKAAAAEAVALREAAKAAAEYKLCGLNPDSLIALFMEYFQNSCDASEMQLRELKHFYNTEMNDHFKHIKAEHSKCPWPSSKVDSEYKAMLRDLSDSFKRHSC